MKQGYLKLRWNEWITGETLTGHLMDPDTKKDAIRASRRSTSQSTSKTISSKGQQYQRTNHTGDYMQTRMEVNDLWDANLTKVESADLCSFALYQG
jgi:hypothetical protein